MNVRQLVETIKYTYKKFRTNFSTVFLFILQIGPTQFSSENSTSNTLLVNMHFHYILSCYRSEKVPKCIYLDWKFTRRQHLHLYAGNHVQIGLFRGRCTSHFCVTVYQVIIFIHFSDVIRLNNSGIMWTLVGGTGMGGGIINYGIKDRTWKKKIASIRVKLRQTIKTWATS